MPQILNRKTGNIIKSEDIKLSDTIKQLREKSNSSFKNIDSNLVNLESGISKVSDNDYIKHHIEGKVIGKDCEINGRYLSKFGKDMLTLDQGGLMITSEHNAENIGKEGGFIFTIKATSEESDVPYAYIDLNNEEVYSNIREGEIIIIKIDDLFSINAYINIGLLGIVDDTILDLSSNRPSITLMKTRDASNSRFLILSYPMINVDADITGFEERIFVLENSVRDLINNTLTWIHVDVTDESDESEE